ncbi:DUF2178 domain-containing protein [Bythopirellula polymerisocia]|uniref:Uncharacterized protein n=1 Tax=Bythopirellula polymerisocia TaxID=2528003 RepID=A0A5C6D306_9BACT|nr:DUF2178 domain-containing protein [Bythopirellula polymerisocia]TWU30161.1 hypothetical protein Pla144_09470 [Bythopirellula polymerisocia]
MNAMEKVAWTELTVSLAALVVVACLYPWLGNGATGAFGLLGILGFSVIFLRRRGQTVIVDERDRDIAQRATMLGLHGAWMTLMMTLVILVLWNSYNDRDAVSISLLNWLIWIQFAICFAVKGLVAVTAYRRQQHAS